MAGAASVAPAANTAMSAAALPRSVRWGTSHAATIASTGPSRTSDDGGTTRRTNAAAANALSVATAIVLTPLVPRPSAIASNTATTDPTAT